MKVNKDVTSYSPVKRKFEVLTYPVAYLQMLVQSVLYKKYSK